MKRKILLKHEFVEHIPAVLKDDTIYVSISFATASHKCCCGCGNEVVTPFSPTDWKMTFDGRSISLSPSIGNWSFPCQSHYWIKQNRVRWAPQWSGEKISAGRAHDSAVKGRYFARTSSTADSDTGERADEPRESKPKKRFWQKLKK